MYRLKTAKSQKKQTLKQLLSRLEKSFVICDKPVKESLAGFFEVRGVARPGIESGVLEGASKTEGNGPGEGGVF